MSVYASFQFDEAGPYHISNVLQFQESFPALYENVSATPCLLAYMKLEAFGDIIISVLSKRKLVHPHY